MLQIAFLNVVFLIQDSCKKWLYSICLLYIICAIYISIVSRGNNIPFLNYVHFSGEKYSIFTCLLHILQFFSSSHSSIFTFLHIILLLHMNMNYQKCIHTHLIFQECKIQKEECIWWSCILFFSYSSSYSYLLSKDTNIILTRYFPRHYILVSLFHL